MKLRNIFVVTILSAAVIIPSASAQQSQVQRLTLASALDLAEKQNLDLIAARAQRAVLLAEVRIAGQRPNPTAFFGALRDTPHESLFFDQPLEVGSKHEKRIELAQQESALKETDIAAVERRVRHDVRDAYFRVAFARGATAQRNESSKLAQRLHDIADARFQAGDIPELEVMQAQLESARAKSNLQVAHEEERVALSDLNALLNEPAMLDWDFGAAFDALPPSVMLDGLLARAAASNSDIERILQESKVQQSQTSLLKADRIPNLSLEFGVDFNNPGQGGFREGARGQVSMELPLFSHNQGQIAQSIANQQVLDAELASARRATDARVESSFFDLEARLAEVQLYRDNILPSSKRLEEMSEESYRSGKANILTVLGAQRDVQQVEQDYLSSLLAVQSAFAQLEEAVGSPLD